MRFLLLFVILSFLATINALPTTQPESPPPSSPADCLVLLQGVTAEFNSISQNISPQEALQYVTKIQEANEKVIKTCCQKPIPVNTILSQYTKQNTQIAQTMSLLSSIPNLVPHIWNIQESFANVPKSIVKCSNKLSGL